MKTALVHDWLTGMRGGEKCLEALCELYPEADLFTLLHVPGSVSPTIENRRIVTSRLQMLPRINRWYRYCLPIMPTAIESLDVTAYDLVISTSHCVAKGVIPRPDAVHIAYMHTPMRYAWDLWPQYFPNRKRAPRMLVRPLLSYLRVWDVASAARVDRFVANSSFVARRIRRYYRRDSQVIHPPVHAGFFHAESPSEDYYLLVAALVPYKGIDLAIEAFNRSKRKLRIVGDGHMRRQLQALAGPTVKFLGRISDDELRGQYARCRALLQPCTEDFGIAPLEANAAGRPVIALGRGGAVDSVVPINSRQSLLSHAQRAEHHPAPTGVFFYDRNSEALEAALRFFETNEHMFHPVELRRHAARFDRSKFKQRMQQLIDLTVEAGPDAPWSTSDQAPRAGRQFTA